MSFSQAHVGVNFTKRIHSKAEGPTDPTSIGLPANFTVVVTGAGKGLGFAIAIAFAKAGASGISISSRTQADLDALAKELKAVNPDAKVVSTVCDTTRDEDVKRLLGDVEGAFGRVDVVVANAGKWIHQPTVGAARS